MSHPLPRVGAPGQFPALAVEIADLLAVYEFELARYARAQNLNRIEVTALLYLSSDDQATPTALADRLGQRSGSVTKVVDRLVARGLAGRQPHPVDRRSVRVFATPSGFSVANGWNDFLRSGARVATGGDLTAERMTVHVLQRLSAEMSDGPERMYHADVPQWA